MDSFNEEVKSAIEYLTKVDHFLENGVVDLLEEAEIENLMKFCSQVEIYYAKFKQKGFNLTVEDGECLLTTSSRSKNQYNLERITDDLLVKFLRPTVPRCQMSLGIHTYLKTLGVDRFYQAVEAFAKNKDALNLASAIRSAEDLSQMESILFMEGFTAVADGKPGMSRMVDLLREFIVEDECVETLLLLFALAADSTHFRTEIKSVLLNHLRDRFKSKPMERKWIKIVVSSNLVPAVNNFPPLTDFVLELISELTKDITYKENQGFVSPEGTLPWRHLESAAVCLYRNKATEQKMKNFIFDKCSSNQEVWLPIMRSCSAPFVEKAPDEGTFHNNSDDLLARVLQWRE